MRSKKEKENISSSKKKKGKSGLLISLVPIVGILIKIVYEIVKNVNKDNK
ncbi:MAG: hypothetical protein KAT05_04350 [Spirochaetes bacterium]|nr:hypothetical protein [Spirochaetota bacterium]